MARKKRFSLNRFIKNNPRQVTMIICCLILIACSVAWYITDQQQQSTIANLEGKLAVLTIDAHPGPAQVTDENIWSDNSSVFIWLDNSYASYIGDTGPMLPWLAEGVLIVLEKTQDVRIGDVVLYDRNGREVLQRIIGESEGQWVIKADREFEAVLVPKSMVIARLAAVLY